ncbi:MAG: hypothetical protein A3C47_01465 [Omnitrophica bacterium RIFCSPHIGHO2_02_FULL_51_18]|nr:MAG: hypothetical protein A3C47_01465 [Omnitrophica bacterium RIFCSPHIGHO2_02_FULL_51_18]
MAEQAVKQEVKQPAAGTGEQAPQKVKKKKLRPTNCVQSNKRIRRKDWYYRDGKYFANKQCFKLWMKQEAEKAKKAGEEAAASAAAQGHTAEPNAA